jgi:HK97 family phage portal protein
MKRIETIAGVLGKAVGSFERQRALARGKSRRPLFLDAEADEARYQNESHEGAQRRSLRNSWVYSAVTMIAREVAGTEFQITRQSGPDDEPIQIPNHPVEMMLRRPNPQMGRSYLWQYTVMWLELDGNAYWFMSGDEIWPIPSHRIDPVPGDRERFVDYYQYTANGTQFNIPAEYIVQFQFPNPFDIFRGLPPLAGAILAADSDTAMAMWNARFFSRDNVMPSAIINLKSGDPQAPIDSGDAEVLKQSLRNDYQAARRKTVITNAPGGVDVALLGWNPKDMDFISGRQFTKEEIYAIFGFPGGLLDKNATEANAVTADKIFKEKTIWPLLCLIAEQFTAQYVNVYYGEAYKAGFADIRTSNRQMEMQEVAAAGPYLLVNEIRERYWQLEPLPDGDRLGAVQGADATGGFFQGYP